MNQGRNNSRHLVRVCARYARERIRVRPILLISLLFNLLFPILISMTWWPPPPWGPPACPGGTSAAIRFSLPDQTVIVEPRRSWCLRVTTYLRSEPDQPDPMRVPVPEPFFQAYQSGKSSLASPYCTYLLSSVGTEIQSNETPIPASLRLSRKSPFGLIAEYGWPFTSVRCSVTGTLLDCSSGKGTLRDAIRLGAREISFGSPSDGSWIFGQRFGQYPPGAPFGSIPTGISGVGFLGNTLFLAAVIYIATLVLGLTKAFRRATRHQCLACGYEVDVTAIGPCPECGLQVWGRGTSMTSNSVHPAPT